MARTAARSASGGPIDQVFTRRASLAITRLVDARLLTADHRATAELFWTAAVEWRPEWINLPLVAFPRDIPTVAVGTHTASLYGAPIIVTADPRPEFLVGSHAALDYASMAASNLNRDRDVPTGRFAISSAAVSIDQIAPVAPLIDGVPAAPEAIGALSLAIDPGRGAETVRGWEGNQVW